MPRAFIPFATITYSSLSFTHSLQVGDSNPEEADARRPRQPIRCVKLILYGEVASLAGAAQHVKVVERLRHQDQEAIMYFAGIDAHVTYSVVAILGGTGELVQKATRFRNRQTSELFKFLEPYRLLEAVVETSPAWPWLHDHVGHGHGFVLAHAKKLRAIAEADYKRDELDAELLARMRLADLIPEVYPKSIEPREQALLVRHRARLGWMRTATANRIHAEIHAVGLRIDRGRLLTRSGRGWVKTHAWPLLGPEQRRLIRTHYALIRGLKPLIYGLDRQIERVGDKIPAVALLRTIPGIGPYRGLLIATELLPP